MRCLGKSDSAAMPVQVVASVLLTSQLFILYSIIIFTYEVQFIEFVDGLVKQNMDEIIAVFWNIFFYLKGEQSISHAFEQCKKSVLYNQETVNSVR